MISGLKHTVVLSPHAGRMGRVPTESWGGEGGAKPAFRYDRHQTHQDSHPHACKCIISYDANMLYLSTMLTDMPCGKEKVVHYHPAKAIPAFTLKFQ